MTQVSGPTHDVSAPRRVAAYVRMSTVWQDQSVPQQLDFIERYAAATQCTVVKVYRDEGKSGLSARRRPGLLQMLADIGTGNAGFEQVLVYDVSRFGRFQDVDESSYYEYWCRQHGVAVIYCGEHFSNDGSPLSHIIKSVKRTMAAEYSRALSVRTFEAHAFLLARGFKPGGVAGYGLRRVCLKADGSVRRQLCAGERKGHPTDRVVLAPGPTAEIDVVRRIYRLFIEDKLGYRALARRLAFDGCAAAGGAPWTEARVKAVLTNEKYCGVLLYNRTTARLGRPRRANDAAMWLRHDGAHEAVVSRAVFLAAQRQARIKDGSDEEAVLRALRALHARHGLLTTRLIDAEPGLPHMGRLTRLFGSFAEACSLALGPGTGCPRSLALHAAQVALRLEVERCVVQAGGRFAPTARASVLRIEDVTVRLAVVHCRSKGAAEGWLIPAQASGADFVLAALLEREEANVTAYVLLAVDSLKVLHRWLPAGGWSVRGCAFGIQVASFFAPMGGKGEG